MQNKIFNKILSIALATTLAISSSGLQVSASSDVQDLGNPAIVDELPDDGEPEDTPKPEHEETEPEESHQEESDEHGEAPNDELGEAPKPVVEEPVIPENTTPEQPDNTAPEHHIEYRVNDDAMGHIEDGTAVANDGFVFVNWTNEAGEEVSSNAEFNTEEDGVYTANFKAVEQKEEPKADPEPDVQDMDEETAEDLLNEIEDNEEIVNTYDITMPAGTEFPVQITFDADVEDDEDIILYHFMDDEWETIEPDEVDDGEITATFNHLSPVAVVRQLEEVEIQAEYLVSDEEAGYIEDNKAVANEHYEFVNWTDEAGNEVSTEAEFTATKSGTYTANFKATEYTITYTASEGGSVTVDTEKVTVKNVSEGSEAKADDAYTFVNWVDVDNNEVSNEPTFVPSNITEDTTYTAVFESKFVETELEKVIGDQKITATGLMPREAELAVEKITIVRKYEKLINDELSEENLENSEDSQGVTFTVYDAFDIKILVNGEEWQPVDDDKTVQITITGIETSNDEENSASEVQVCRVADDESEVTKLDTELNGDTVVFETEHFTAFIIGGVSYDVTPTFNLDDDATGSAPADFVSVELRNDGYCYGVLPDNGGDIAWPVVSNSDHTYDFYRVFKGWKCDGVLYLPGETVRFKPDEVPEFTVVYKAYEQKGSNTWDLGAVIYEDFQDKTPDTTVTAADGVNTLSDFSPNGTVLDFADGGGHTLLTHYNSDYGLSNKIHTASELQALPTVTGFDIKAYKVGRNIFMPGETIHYVEPITIFYDYELSTAKTFTINGVNYSTNDATASWDLSKDQDGSIMAYFFEDEKKLVITGSGQMKDFWFSSPFSSAVSNKDVTVEWVDADGITNIGGSLFYNKKCTITSLPSGITSIDHYAFDYCKNCVITEIPENVEAIGDYAFTGAGITDLTIHGNCKTIGTWAFQTCYLESLTLEEGIETIGDSAFNANRSEGWLGMTELVIPDSVTTISNGAFGYNRGITKISGGNGITSLGTNVFVVSQGSTTVNTTLITDNDILKDYDWVGDKRIVSIPKIITIDGTDYDVTDITPVDISLAQNESLLAYYIESSNTVLISGAGPMKDYVYNTTYGGEKSPLKDYSGYTVIWDDQGITSIGDYFFSDYGGYGSTNTATFTALPTGLTKIGQHAFGGCVNFNQAIPSGVTSIGSAAFQDCTGLTITSLPSGLTYLGTAVFSGCTSLTEMTIPSGITSIGEFMFQSCSNLHTVTLGSGTTSIGQMAFSYCSNLATVNNMDDITSIRKGAFSNTAVTFSTLPAGLTSLGPAAFSGCTGITAMTVNTAAITSNAASYDSQQGLSSLFAGCTNLTYLDLSGWDMSAVNSTANMINNSGVTTLVGPAVAPQDSAALNGTFFEKDSNNIYVSTKCYEKLNQTAGKTLTKEALVYKLELPATADNMATTGNIMTASVEYNATYNGDGTKEILIQPGTSVTMTDTVNASKTFVLTAAITASDQKVTIAGGTLNGDADTADHYYTKTGHVTLTSPNVSTISAGNYAGNIEIAWTTQDAS